jgi:hypothetical protein
MPELPLNSVYHVSLKRWQEQIRSIQQLGHD